MREYQRRKLNKILLISVIILIVVTIISGIMFYVTSKNKEQKNLYNDTLVANNYFSQIIVNLNKKEVKRDEIETTFQKEFNITEEQENIILSSQEKLQNFFSSTVFEVEIEKDIAYITNRYQTKQILIKTSIIEDNFNAKNVTHIQDDIYLLEYDTQKRTKAALEFFESVDWIKKAEVDEVLYIEPINDESQTVYGEENNQEEIKYNTYGIDAMGLAKFQNIIKENGNPSEVIVSTIGYGVCIENKYFQGRINENYYNFIEDSKNIQETIPQGSRVAEVIKEATTDNVKILPLVVVNNEGYTTISSIIKAIEYAIQNSDIICYELVNLESYMINLALEKAFKENKPFSCVTTVNENVNQIYPANSATTIAVSSIDKSNKITTFSGRGEYIDFAAHSTDIEEIFDKNSTVSKWSGSQYSNAHIVAAMALIKTYHKEYTILEIYNVLRNHCIDLGKKGKDELYGYGCPDFSNITIADIDKEAPVIREVKYENENWEQSKQIQIIASDNIRILEWTITTSLSKPEKWNKLEEVKPTLDIIHEIKENNRYYVWVKDSAENTSYMPIEINKIDNKSPEIIHQIDSSTLETQGYVTISVTAEDKDSGLNEMPYSWDGQNWGSENNLLKVTENGRHKIYVRDVLGNVSEKEVIVDVFPRMGIANIGEGTIIKSIVVSSNWSGNTNNNVRITLNEGLNLMGWRITNSNEEPSYFEEIQNDYLEDEDTEYQNTESEDVEDPNEYEYYEQYNSIYNESFTTENLVVEEELPQGYNSSVTFTERLEIGTIYYAWIKDVYGNISYQTFSISKVEI